MAVSRVVMTVSRVVMTVPSVVMTVPRVIMTVPRVIMTISLSNDYVPHYRVKPCVLCGPWVRHSRFVTSTAAQ